MPRALRPQKVQWCFCPHQHPRAVSNGSMVNMRLAAQLGWQRYEVLCDVRGHLLGEWLFARAAFGEGAPDDRLFVEAFGEDMGRVCAELGVDLSYLLKLREKDAPAFAQECLETVRWDDYDVIGFSSVFEQNCAALALARLLKDRYPHLITVFGGANFEDEMGLEYVRALPWIDYAVIGEGDEVFPALLERLAAGEEVLDMPGIARRGAGGVLYGGRAPMVANLDALPEPEYSAYFAAVAELGRPETGARMFTMLPFETARGCWWGQKHHCTFCGLNALGMAYRSKSPARVLAGLDEMARRYHLKRFEAVDNILDHRYIKDVFVPLAEQGKGYEFFYEVKANLTPEQVGALARGGLRAMQPGIESLSTHVLKLMRKGTTAIQNVRLLKWATYHGVEVAWNVLLGFPGERPEDYEAQLATMRLIPHLQPPGGANRIWLERYSPNFTEAEERGMLNVRADSAYAHVYPGHLDMERIAYFFEYDAPDTCPPVVHAPLHEYIRWWQEAVRSPRPPFLVYQYIFGRLAIIDGRRQTDQPLVHTFDGPAALAYEFCSRTYHGAPQVLAHLRGEHGVAIDLAAVQRDLDNFAALGLMMEEDGHYLSLALPTSSDA